MSDVSGTCTVGFPGRARLPGAEGAHYTPWESGPLAPGSKSNWPGITDMVNSPWLDRYARSTAGAGRCGDRHYAPCIPTGSSGAGNCISSKYWSDDLWLKYKGAISLMRKKEPRVRHLLKRLVVAFSGFQRGLDAYAYDASFCGPVIVDPAFRHNVVIAYQEMNRKYPDSRWIWKSRQFEIKCAKQVCLSGRYYLKAAPSACYREAILAAPSICVGTSGRGRIDQRFVPLQAAIKVVGDRLVPTSWMRNLIDCLVPASKKYKFRPKLKFPDTPEFGEYIKCLQRRERGGAALCKVKYDAAVEAKKKLAVVGPKLMAVEKLVFQQAKLLQEREEEAAVLFEAETALEQAAAEQAAKKRKALIFTGVVVAAFGAFVVTRKLAK